MLRRTLLYRGWGPASRSCGPTSVVGGSGQGGASLVCFGLIGIGLFATIQYDEYAKKHRWYPYNKRRFDDDDE